MRSPTSPVTSAPNGRRSSRPPACASTECSPKKGGDRSMRAGELRRTANSLIGSPIERLEDFRFLRGGGQFVDDIACAGLLHAVILRSSVAHGRIRSIDTAAALARPGVHAVITAAEIGSAVPTIPLRQELLPVF